MRNLECEDGIDEAKRERLMDKAPSFGPHNVDRQQRVRLAINEDRRRAKVSHAPQARFDRWAQASFLAWAGV